MRHMFVRNEEGKMIGCIAVAKENDKILVSGSALHGKDNFSRKKGRLIAYNRLTNGSRHRKLLDINHVQEVTVQEIIQALELDTGRNHFSKDVIPEHQDKSVRKLLRKEVEKG